MNAERQTGADESDGEQNPEGDQIDQQRGMVGKDPLPAGAEAENVHGHRQCLGQIERDADAAAHLQTQRLGDDVEGAAGADADIGGDGRQGKSGEAGDGKGDQDDDPGAEQTGVADHPTLPQEHDDAENRQQGWREHPAKGAEQLLLRGFFLLLLDFDLFLQGFFLFTARNLTAFFLDHEQLLVLMFNFLLI